MRDDSASTMDTEEEPVVSVIVTCKGRLHHLRETLPMMLAQECTFNYEVIVIDYGCPHGTFDWLRSLDCRKILAVRVCDGTLPFNLSRARNCGAAFANAATFAFVDADMRLHTDWLTVAAAPVLAGEAGLCKVATIHQGWDRGGTCVVSQKLFCEIRGYDEGCVGWGGEDEDFYDRCGAVSILSKYPTWLITPIAHSHTERARYYEQSIVESDTKNLAYLAERSGVINRLGFGIGQFEVFRGTGNTLPPITWAARPRLVQHVRLPKSVDE
jgi:glycosyltransferase involved in cell wall biosynthesis